MLTQSPPRQAEFYTNMRQHTDLCAQVERRARQWALLHALNVMFTTSRLCGPRMCVEYANDLVVRGIAWPIAMVLGILVMTMPSIITRCSPHLLIPPVIAPPPPPW